MMDLIIQVSMGTCALLVPVIAVAHVHCKRAQEQFYKEYEPFVEYLDQYYPSHKRRVAAWTEMDSW